MSRHELLASAFGALESDIAEIAGAEAVLDVVSRTVLQPMTADGAESFGVPTTLTRSYKMFMLSEEQEEALSYALLHLGDVVRKLEEHYRDLERQAVAA